MKSSILMFVLISILFLVPAHYTFAEGTDTDVTVDLKDLDYNTRNAILEQMKKKAQNTMPMQLPKIAPSVAKEWVTVVTGAIKDLCHDLGVEVNQFIKTPVGMLIAATLVYRVVGRDFLTSARRVFFAVTGWFVSMAFLYLFVARKFFIGHKLKYVDTWTDKERGLIKRKGFEFKKPYEFNSNDARTAAASFMAGTAIVLTVLAAIMCMV